MDQKAILSGLEAIPWLLVVIGWMATHLLSEARERRKSVRERFDKLVAHVVALEAAGRSFHMAQQYDETAANAILASLDRLERMADRSQALDMDALVPLLIHHRRALTLKNFDSSSFQAQPGSSDILADIADATSDFEDDIERQYVRRYPSNFPYFTMLEFKKSARQVSPAGLDR